MRPFARGGFGALGANELLEARAASGALQKSGLPVEALQSGELLLATELCPTSATIASHAVTQPLCSGRSALPVLRAMRAVSDAAATNQDA